MRFLRFQRGSRRALAGSVHVAWALGLSTAVAAPSALALDGVPVAVHPAEKHQRISGFGASSAWTAPSITDAEADELFSPDKGAGLSLLRVRIDPSGVTWETNTAASAQARGATVWATPWSPPAEWKSNNNVNYGGNLLPEHADDWAARLVAFVQSMQAQGINIAWLSPQNEPTMSANYESCIYTPTTLTDFVAHHLAPAMVDAGLTAKIIAPETVGWSELPAFANPMLADPTAAPAVGVVATHSYSGSPGPYAGGDPPRELWQTEMSDKSDPDAGDDVGMESALRVATMMHAALVYASVDAWHYWWIKPNANTNDKGGVFTADTTSPDGGARVLGVPTKRLWVMGNYARFVRPGYVRIGTSTTAPNPGVSVTAFTFDDLASQANPQKHIVLVAINTNTEMVTERVRFDSVATGSWASWVTSAASDLSPGAATTADGNDILAELDPQSVTTLQGVITGPGPALPVDSTTAAPGGGGCACEISFGARSPGARSIDASLRGRVALFGVLVGLTLARSRRARVTGRERARSRRSRRTGCCR